jgi:hypothetical protein
MRAARAGNAPNPGDFVVGAAEGGGGEVVLTGITGGGVDTVVVGMRVVTGVGV